MLVREINAFINSVTPWTVKDLRALCNYSRTILEAIRIVASLLYPVMPTKMKSILDCFSAHETNLHVEMSNFTPLKIPLFPRKMK